MKILDLLLLRGLEAKLSFKIGEERRPPILVVMEKLWVP